MSLGTSSVSSLTKVQEGGGLVLSFGSPSALWAGRLGCSSSFSVSGVQVGRAGGQQPELVSRSLLPELWCLWMLSMTFYSSETSQ